MFEFHGKRAQATACSSALHTGKCKSSTGGRDALRNSCEIREELRMRFYYFSPFSWMAYVVVVSVGIVLLWLLWTKLLKLKTRNPVYWVLAAAILVAPWAEELWIAYNFDRLCTKDAGVFVKKTVDVEGFYDDTHGWRPDKLRASGYRFVEGRDRQAIWRHEYVGNEIRSVKIDKPTARYQYKTSALSARVTHKIRKTEHRVEDRQTGELLGRETTYARDAYWFFIGLDAPVMLCPLLRERPDDLKGMLYENVLKTRNRRQT